MSDAGFAYADRFTKGLPDAAPRFAGFPKFNFIGGHNDTTQIPTEELGRAAVSVLAREGSKLAMYNLGEGPQGYPGLRNFVADKLTRHRGMKVSGGDVMITSGSGQGIDLVSRLLLEAGDIVLLEEFSYQGAITKYKKAGMEVIGMPIDEDGIRIDALEKILDGLKARGKQAKLIYTIPTIQNPTGSILPLDRRHGLIALAKKHGVPIFEDECYADLIWAGSAPPSLYALDPSQVIHIGSFSKSLAPALRVGYAVADWSVLSRMVACKSDGGTGALDQMVIAEYFSQNFDAHIGKLSKVLGEKLDVMVEAVDREFGSAVQAMRPQGGIFLWLKFPENVDVRKLMKPAAERGIVFNAGPEWACDAEAGKSHLRLCFALPSKENIREGVAALAKVCFEEIGIPERSGNVRRVS